MALQEARTGELALDAVNRLVRAYNALEAQVKQLADQLAKTPQAATQRAVRAVSLYCVTASTPVEGSAGRWTYTVRPCAYEGATASYIGTEEYTAYNTVESQLTPIHGCGVDVTALEADFPDMDVQPCPAGTVVMGQIYLKAAGGYCVLFAYANGIDGTC